MEEGAVIREGARDFLGDVEPDRLREEAVAAVEDAWLAPGIVTIAAARTTGVEEGDADLRRRAVGVQLIYTGLALTRRLVETEPWAGEATDAGNVDVLVADVLVARGGNLLADTEAVERGVEVVREFGRRRSRDEEGAPRVLEADVLDLAAVAGSTVSASTPSSNVREWVGDRAAEIDAGDLPDVGTLLPTAETTTSTTFALAGERRGSRTDP